jgi:hypothetical protein
MKCQRWKTPKEQLGNYLFFSRWPQTTQVGTWPQIKRATEMKKKQ